MLTKKSPYWQNNLSNEVKGFAKSLGFKGDPGDSAYFLKNLMVGFERTKETHPAYYVRLQEKVFENKDRPFEDRPVTPSDLLKIKHFYEKNANLNSSIYLNLDTAPIEVIEFVYFTQSPKGEKYISHAAEAKDWDKFQSLIEIGVQDNFLNAFNTLGNILGDDTLEKAKTLELLTLALKLGADPNRSASIGSKALYPLEHAIATENKELADLLLYYGASPAVISKEYRTVEWFKEFLDQKNKKP